MRVKELKANTQVNQLSLVPLGREAGGAGRGGSEERENLTRGGKSSLNSLNCVLRVT